MKNHSATIAFMLVVLALLELFHDVFAEEICSYSGAEYLGNHPDEKSPNWQNGVQGLTHGEGDSDAYWYITLTKPNMLWRIPFTHKLSDSVSCFAPGVKCDFLVDIPFLKNRGYDHYGDLDYYDPDPNDDKGGYVFVPLEIVGNKRRTGGVAAFRTPGLEFAGFTLAHVADSPAPWHMPWVAFDDKGNLYTSEGGSPNITEYLGPRGLNKWKVDWDLLENPDVNIQEESLRFLAPLGKVTLLWKMPEDFEYRAMCIDHRKDGRCNAGEWIRNVEENVALPGDLVPLGLKTPQGADFSEDGRLLAILNGPLGDGRCPNRALRSINSDHFENLPREGCGIHIFEVSADSDNTALCSSTEGDCKAVRVDHSYNGGKKPFNYQYDPTWPKYEEPEGLDWFDMDKPGAPDIPGDAGDSCTDPVTGDVLKPCPVGGQVHAILLDHEFWLPNDDVYIKHYRITRGDCQDASEQAIQVSPSFYNFEEVPVGGGAQTGIEISNSGNVDLQIDGIAFENAVDVGFDLNGVPTLPAVLGSGDSKQVGVSFTPQTVGSFAAVLEIHSDVPDTPIISVPLTATAIGFPEQVRNLIEALDEGLASGDLSGAGPGKSAGKRAGAFRNMLLSALEYVETEIYEDACSEMKAALNRADSAEPPFDFIAGPAVTVLAEEITALRSRLGCK